MTLNNFSLEIEEDIDTAIKILQKINIYILNVYGAYSDVGIIWLKVSHQLKKTRLFTIISEERKEQAETILKDIVENIDDYFFEYIVKLYLYDIVHVPLNVFYKSVGLDDLADKIEKTFEDMPERVPYEYIAPITTDSRELLILTKLNNVYENKTKNEILDKLINILNKLNQEGYCVCTFTDTRGQVREEGLLFHDIVITVEECKDNSSINNYVEETITKQSKPKVKKERTSPISISKGQDNIRDILFNNNISFKQEYSVTQDDKKHRFDFAIFDESGLSYLIEYDGEQHFHPVEQMGGEEGYQERVKADQAKNQWAKEHNVKLIRIPYHYTDVCLNDLDPSVSTFVVK